MIVDLGRFDKGVRLSQWLPFLKWVSLLVSVLGAPLLDLGVRIEVGDLKKILNSQWMSFGATGPPRPTFWVLGFVFENAVDDLAAVDNLDGAVAGSHELFVGVDAELIVDGGHEVGSTDGVFFGFAAEGIGSAIDEPFFDPASCEHDGEDAGPVIAAAVFVDFRSAAELGGEHDEGVVEHAAIAEVAEKSRNGMVDVGHGFAKAVFDVLVVVPASGGEGDEADPSLHETTCEKHALAGLMAAVEVARFVGLLFDVEGFARFLGRDELVGVVVEGVHGGDLIGVFQVAEVGVDGIEKRAAACEAFLAHAFGKVEVADLVVFVGRIGTDGERSVGGGEVARVGEFVGHLRNANVGREVFARAEFVGDHGAHRRILQGGRRAVAGEHVVGSAFVGSLAVGHGPDDGELVCDFGQLRDFFAKTDAGEGGLDRAIGATILGRSEGFGVEGLLMRHSAWQEDIDDGGGYGLVQIVVLEGCSGLLA